jgi:hypothetical protein
MAAMLMSKQAYPALTSANGDESTMAILECLSVARHAMLQTSGIFDVLLFRRQHFASVGLALPWSLAVATPDGFVDKTDAIAWQASIMLQS